MMDFYAWRANPAWMSSWIIYMTVLRIECHIPLDPFLALEKPLTI